MLGIFIYALNAIMPIILLIMLGYVLKKVGFLTSEFLRIGNKLVFDVCLPCLLFYNVYNIEGFGTIEWSTVGFCVACCAVLFICGMATAHFIEDKRRKGVRLQCVFRSNFAIIGVPLAESLGGSAAVATASVLSAFTITSFNALAVVALSIYLDDGKGGHISAGHILKKIVTNPLIIGIVTAIVMLIIRQFIPVNTNGELAFSFSGTFVMLYKTVENLARMASPLALIVLGGQFEFSAAGGMLREIVIGTVWRIVLAPVITIGAAILLSRTGAFNFGTAEYPAFIAQFGTPVAVASAIMAGEMGNDELLAGQLVVWTSLFSIVTIFLLIVVLRTMGLI